MTFLVRIREHLWGPRGDYLAVGALFLAIGVFLQGDGRIPMGDSWSFAWTAAELVDGGRLALTEAQAMTLVSQVLLVAPVAAVFSPSPSTLNRFTLILSAVTLGVFLHLYRRLGSERMLSLLAVATLGTNTIWISQSLSYETEIYFLFFSALGTVALMSWDPNSQKSAPWLAGIAFAASAGVRQHALLFSLAGVACSLPSVRLRLRAYLPWLLPLAVVAMVYVWLYTVHGVPKAYGWQRAMLRYRYSDLGNSLWISLTGAVACIHYLGWFMLPVTLACVRWPAERWARLGVVVAASVFTFGTAALALTTGQAMPYLRNVIDPNTLLLPLGLGNWSNAVDVAWTLASTLGGVLLIAALADLPRRARAARVSTPLFLFSLLVALLFLAFYLLIGLAFDRYLLLPMPFLIAVLVTGCPASPVRLRAATATIVAGMLVTLPMIGHRVRSATCEWDAAQALLQSGIPATRINGGGAFNGYYSYDFLMRDPSRIRNGPAVPWVQPRAEYLVTPSTLAVPGLALVSRTSCASFPGMPGSEILTYQCAPSPAPGPPTLCQPFVH